MDATELSFPDSSFDLIYSTNCFEHIGDLGSAFHHIYRVLRPKGILFTVFAPIWSGPVGHHTWIWDGDTPLMFSQNLFPDWLHLLLTEGEFRTYLSGKYSEKIIDKMCRYIYRSNDINRKIDSLYEMEIAEYNFSPIVNYRLRSRVKPGGDILERLKANYPHVKDFRTLGYFWILSKGECALRKKVRVYTRGMIRIVWQKIFARQIHF
jgi:SAM-dependent methyltransferase